MRNDDTKDLLKTNDSLLLSNDFKDQNEMNSQFQQSQDEDSLFISQLQKKELKKLQEFDIKIDPDKLGENA